MEDNGPGIPELDMPYLFRRFYRGSNAAPGSAGIGLALAAELVRAQGGSVVAENQTPGPGARFILKLPIHPGSFKRKETASILKMWGQQRRCPVLIPGGKYGITACGTP